MAGSKKKRSAAKAEAIFVLAAIGAAIGLGVIGFFLGRDTAPNKSSSAATPTATAPATTAASTTTTAATTTSAADAGKAIFVANCGSCHTLKNAGTSGAVGPNLDDLKPSTARVVKQVTNGGKIMPAFKGTLTAAQIAAVSAYVSQVAGK
jgi:cytochrome c6